MISKKMTFHSKKENADFPHNLELEQAVLGCMEMDSQSRLQLLDELSEEDFYYEEHQNIFRALQLFSKESINNEKNDVLSFLIFVENKGLTSSCESREYISHLTEIAPDVLNLERYTQLLKVFTTRRKAIEQAQETIKKAQNPNEDISTAIDLSISSFVNISNDTTEKKSCVKGSLIAKSIKERIEKYGLEIPATTIIPSGFQELDRKIGGFREGQFSIIGARPSVGKTAFSLSICLNMLINYFNVINKAKNGELTTERRKPKIGFYSLEMPREDIVLRLLSSLSCVNANIVYGTKKTTDETIKTRLNNGIKILEKELLENFFIYESSKMDIATLRGSIRALKVKENIDIVFIDYLQLIDTSKLRGGELWERMQEVSTSLKILAKELKIPIVCLSQLNREAENKRPNLANLRNSGAIEQDADLIIFLHDQEREKTQRNYKGCSYNQGSYSIECVEARPTNVIIAKQRNGEIGESQLVFLSDFVRFAEVKNCSFYDVMEKND